MGMMEEMMDAMMGKLSKEEKLEMMSTMMGKFLAGFTVEDRQKMMERMMPKMMEGVNMMDTMPKMMMRMMGGGEGNAGMMGMMSQMMGDSEAKQGLTMPRMMTRMMPQCLHMMLPGVPKEERSDFVVTMVAALMEQGSIGMSDEEKEGLVSKVLEKVRP